MPDLAQHCASPFVGISGDVELVASLLVPSVLTSLALAYLPPIFS